MLIEYEINPRYYSEECQRSRRPTANGSRGAVLALPGSK
jgi:hypothetical protein